MVDQASLTAEAAADERAESGDAPAPRPLLPRLLALWALFGVGITQPILDLYGRNPEVLIAARATRAQVVVFALVATLGPVLLAAGVLLATKALFGERAQTVVFLVLLGIAGFTAASAVFRQLLPDTDLTLLLAVVVAAGIPLLYVKLNAVRLWLSVLAVLPAGALVLFLFFSESSELVWEAEPAADPSVVVDNPVPIVLLVLDEFPLSSIVTPDGGINEALFPNFARLAEASHWFQNAQSNSIATTDSVPIILSSAIKEGASPTSRDHPRTLFTMLGDSYAMDVDETITDLCPSDVCDDDPAGDEVRGTESAGLRTLLLDASVVWGHRTQPPSIRDRLPSIDTQWGGFLKGDATETAAPAEDGPTSELPLPPEARAGWMTKMLTMADHVGGDWPFSTVHYTHAETPHVPWLANPSGTGYVRPEDLRAAVTGVENGYWVDEPAWARQGLQRHLFQLGLVDLLLGRIIEQLEHSGLWDDALIIVTADHGASFSPGDHRRWVTETNLDALYRVPLFIRTPGQDDGDVRTENAYSEDILPTIVDVIGAHLGPEWDLAGDSLLDADVPDTRPHEYDHFTGHREALGGPLDGLFDEVEAVRALVPDQSSWRGVAAVGPHADLVNRPVTELDPDVDDRIVAEVDQEPTYADLDPDAGVVPTVLTGRVTMPPELTERDVLVAVNGIVSGAGSRVAANGDTSVFQALVPEEAYRPGPNEVTVLVPTGTGGWLQAASGAVERIVLRDATGAELAVAPAGDRRVVIDATSVESDQLRLQGWAADIEAKRPADEILVYFGDQLVHHGPPNAERTDVVGWYHSDDLLMSGFDLRIPASEIPAGTERVTVAGRFADEAVVVYASVPEG
jgi:hypothetical protein